MTGRKVALYYAWDRAGEVNVPLSVIENRFPALFESRRMLWPRLEEFSDPARFEQGIAGFLDHILKPNYIGFIEQTTSQTGHPVVEIERIDAHGKVTLLDAATLDGIDTLIVISFDSLRTGQKASAPEVDAIRMFLDDQDHLVFICPHHDIGDAKDLSGVERLKLEEVHFLHHKDRTIPPQQRFGGYGRSLLAGLGIPVENHFGLHPATTPDGSPAPIEIDGTRDRLNLLNGVSTFNLHPHLPHLERLGDAQIKLDVLARQAIDLTAPPHPFVKEGHLSFDALLQSRPEVFAGSLLVSDATLWSSQAGGLDSLRRLWTNVIQRPSGAALR